MLDRNAIAAARGPWPGDSEPSLLSENVLISIENAQGIKEQYDEAIDVLRTHLEFLLCKAMPIGMRLEKWLREAQPWARTFNTVRGRDHGTKIFIVAGPIRVDVNVTHPDISTWYCEATPISENTGLPMNGKSRGADGGRLSTVSIKGSIFDCWRDSSDETTGILKLIDFVEEQEGRAANAIELISDAKETTT